MEATYEEEEFYLLRSLDELFTIEEGRPVGLKNEEMKIFFPASLYMYAGYHKKPNVDKSYHCLIPVDPFAYGHDFSAGWSSRIYLDSARLLDYQEHNLRLWVKKKENSVRFIID